MKRTRLHALNPESARKRIEAAKSNEPFMAALLDRGHRGHKDAVDQWTRLHEVAFQEPKDRPSQPHRGRANSRNLDFAEPDPADHSLQRSTATRSDNGRSRAVAVGSRTARRSANTVRTHNSRKAGSRKQGVSGGGSGDERGPERLLQPDPERPLNVDQQAISPLLRQPGESESEWIRRVLLAARGVQNSAEQLKIVREAVLQEIGFYEVGLRPAARDGRLADSDWRVLAALQNVPLSGWDRADRLDEAQADLEQRGTLGQFEVIGPDGNLYHRLTILGANPVGDLLDTIDTRIQALRPPPPGRSFLWSLDRARRTKPSRQGGTPPRGPLAANVAPQVLQVIRSRQAAADAGLIVGLAGATALQRSGRFDMDRAPDLPPPPGFEPPERPQNDESFDEASIEVEWIQGFDAPELDRPKVLIFPDVSEEIYRTLIVEERRERQATKDQIDAIRDFHLDRHSDWRHGFGGRDKEGNEMREFRIEGPGVAFKHPITGRPGDSRPGSIYVDLTLETPQGHVHIQTVDIDRDGLPTEQELKQARRIAEVTGRPVFVYPKIWQLEELERRNSDIFPIEVR